MPVWHEKVQPWIAQKKLVVLGVTQEQHPNRCQLFAQWKQIDWPILHDPINVVGCSGVPIVVAIDERGIVRSVGPQPDTFEADFLDKTFVGDDASADVTPVKAARPDLDALRRDARRNPSADAWRQLGDALVLWSSEQGIEEAIGAYTRAIRLAPDDGDAQFRLGVCYRMRHDSATREPGDFQKAVDHWSAARSVRPNWYIWRRRIEQYGPRLIKPYPFYDWVATAKADIKARGAVPIELPVELSGAEIARPSRSFQVEQESLQSPDPDGRIHRDTDELIVADATVVPARIAPGSSTRVHVTLRPSADGQAHWNNESEPLRLWIDPPPGWQVERRSLHAPQGNKPETSEPRHLEFELKAPADATGAVEVPAYALYYVCEEAGGTCLFLRQDIRIMIHVGAKR